MIRTLPPLTIALCVLGCGAKVVTLQDQGTACVYPPNQAPSFGPDMTSRTYAPDSSFTVHVDYGACLSSSCDTRQSDGCQVRLEGSALIVEGRFEYKSKSGACTSDCGLTLSTCETPALPAGTYTVRYGGGEATLEVGADQAAPCAAAPL